MACACACKRMCPYCQCERACAFACAHACTCAFACACSSSVRVYRTSDDRDSESDAEPQLGAHDHLGIKC